MWRWVVPIAVIVMVVVMTVRPIIGSGMGRFLSRFTTILLVLPSVFHFVCGKKWNAVETSIRQMCSGSLKKV